MLLHTDILLHIINFLNLFLDSLKAILCVHLLNLVYGSLQNAKLLLEELEIFSGNKRVLFVELRRDLVREQVESVLQLGNYLELFDYIGYIDIGLHI